jgi:hypothetical protein
MFTGTDFGVAVRIVSFGVGPDRTAELAIDVEVGGFRGIVKEPNVSFRRVLRRRDGAAYV